MFRPKILFLLIISSLVCVNSFASEVKRSILAVVDGEEAVSESSNLIFKSAAMPLYHIGYTIDYVDVTRRLPPDEEMKKYAGIISWFMDNKMKGAASYAKWLTRQLNNGYKAIIIDQFGFQFDENLRPIPEEVMRDFQKAFRIEAGSQDETDISMLIEAVHIDPAMVEFERKFKNDLPYFMNIKTLDKNAKVFLKLKRKETGSTSDAVFINSRGGFVLSGYASYLNLTNYQKRWWIDPFKFFPEVFDTKMPKPDVTTINGSRIFFAQIDGDGLENISKIDGKTYSSKMIYDRILSQVRLPTSVSVIVGSFLSSGKEASKELRSIAKNMFSLPNVEAASHGIAHPLIWDKAKRKVAYKPSGYEYSPENEIGGSIKYINENLVPDGKKTNTFFWTGDCRPDYDALKYVTDNGILALNGGDTRFDRQFPSYLYVPPPFRYVNGLRQNFTVGANEDLYTKNWEGPFYAQKYALETYKNTEFPMRVRAIDIYYHFYTGEHDISIDSIKSLYDWAESQDVSPIYASDYVGVVNGMITTKIEELGVNGWRIKNNNVLRTIRFDNEKNNVDMKRSKGVLGFNRYQGSLYVHLDNGKESDIFLTGAHATAPYLVKAAGSIKDWAVSNGGISFKLRAIGRLSFVIGGLSADSTFKVTADKRVSSIRADKNGELKFNLDLPDIRFDWVEITVKQTH
ncbi:MAG: hypothetical protein COV46_01220 [Deltaproteobacteria bacterium CG11_big_fil_rev_8_21_14_0_20_49_13]|nr:MAG: hypothetical protein COV46_01220 [Deltaproteobacteria bacterium CG11_big_fil_rev_8_21_14_0_20_49_13]